MAYGILRVTIPGTQPVEHRLDMPSLLVGRSPDNRIVIDSVSVSRRHARLTFDSGYLFVEDLGGSGGTFINGTRLVPQQRYRLDDGQSFFLADVEAVLLRDEAVQEGVAREGAQGEASTPQGVAISVASPHQPIEAGGREAIVAEVTNRGNVVDEFTLGVAGVPATWADIARTNLTLMPGRRDEVVITLQPPRSPEARAGQHEFAVSATSAASGAEVRVLAELRILAYYELEVDITPRRGPGRFTLAIENRGNERIECTLRGEDDEAALEYAFEPAELSLEPGETRNVALQASMTAPLPEGELPPWSFAVFVESSAGTFAAATIDGQLLLERRIEPVPEVESETPVVPREPAKEDARRFNWKPIVTSIYVGAIGVLVGLMLAEGSRTFWGILLTAWVVGAPLGALGWRTTATLSGTGVVLTRAGCLVATVIGSLVLGIAVAIFVHSNL